MLHVMSTRLRPGHLSVRVGDGSRRSEETVKKSRIAPLSAIIINVAQISDVRVEEKLGKKNIDRFYTKVSAKMRENKAILHHVGAGVSIGACLISCFINMPATY